MNTLTVKLPASLDAELKLASKRHRVSRSELVRRAIAAYVAQPADAAPAASALALAGDLVGCFTGGPADLASNPRHMDSFGKP